MLTKKSLLKAVRKEQEHLPVNIELKDLLCSFNEEFIYNAFKFILNREPDPVGKHLYLSKLKKGELTKKDIIIILRYSDEGQKAGVKIIGLKKAIFMGTAFKAVPIKMAFKAVPRKIALKAVTLWGQLLKPSPEKCGGGQLLKLSPNKTVSQFTGLSPTEYAEFEEHFRGKEEEVKKKFNIYTPVLSDVLERFRIERIKAVDLGCGRGEWLEILQEYGVDVLGVEINNFFLNKIKKKNLSAVKADVFDFLKKTKDDTFHIVTAFHIIEHIDTNLRVKFLREVLRVLKKGGICILETPNPRNLLVGSGDFYRDPSHITPFFPDTIQFIGKTIGFSDSMSFFLEKEGLVEIDKYPFESLENYISVSRDFAWIGQK